MDRTYIQWNIVNWVTVVLMASVGILAVGFIMSGLKQYKLPATNPNSQA